MWLHVNVRHEPRTAVVHCFSQQGLDLRCNFHVDARCSGFPLRATSRRPLARKLVVATHRRVQLQRIQGNFRSLPDKLLTPVTLKIEVPKLLVDCFPNKQLLVWDYGCRLQLVDFGLRCRDKDFLPELLACLRGGPASIRFNQGAFSGTSSSTKRT